MNKILAIAAAFLVGLTGAAQATTVDVLLGSTSGSETYSYGGTLTSNIALPSTELTTIYPLSSIVSGSVSYLYTEPNGTTGNYLAVFGPANFANAPQGVAFATLSTGPTENVFGFTWGSVDTYNYVYVTDSKNNQYTITGSDIIRELAGSGQTQADVIIKDPNGYIKSIVFESAANTFEVANLMQLNEKLAAVPLPGSVGLFLAALGGLFFLRRKQII